jgi:hypothetical protein
MAGSSSTKRMEVLPLSMDTLATKHCMEAFREWNTSAGTLIGQGMPVGKI